MELLQSCTKHIMQCFLLNICVKSFDQTLDIQKTPYIFFSSLARYEVSTMNILEKINCMMRQGAIIFIYVWSTKLMAALCKTAASSLLMYWRYHSLSLSRCNNVTPVCCMFLLVLFCSVASIATVAVGCSSTGRLSGLIIGLHPANERRRYKVTPSLTGWAQT